MASYFGERALERNDDLKREVPQRVHYYAPTPLIGNLARCQKTVLRWQRPRNCLFSHTFREKVNLKAPLNGYFWCSFIVKYVDIGLK